MPRDTSLNGEEIERDRERIFGLVAEIVQEET